MDTFEFIAPWNARIPGDWEMEATAEPGKPDDFIRVSGLDLVFLPGTRCRGIPEIDAQRMVDQQLIRKIEE